MVTVDHSDIVTGGTETTVDNTDAVDVDDLASAPEWLKYLNSTLTAAGAGYTLDLTGGAFELAAGTSDTEATALFNALQALDSTLKTKIDVIKIKLAAGDHGAGTLDLSGTLNNAAGFDNLTRIIVDVTDAETDVGGTQKIINWAGVTTEAGVKKVMWVTDLDSVDFDSANATDSWHAYVNYITRSGNAALDTSAINAGGGLTVAQLNSVFDALANFSAANDNPDRLTAATAKMATAAGAGTFAVNQFLTNLSGITSIVINVTDAMDNDAQVTVEFGINLSLNTVTKEARIASLASVDVSNYVSWGYYLNHLKAMNGDIVSIDLSSLDLANTDTGTTQPYVDSFFIALDERADRTEVKDIFFNFSGVNNLSLCIGDGVSCLDALTTIVIRQNGSSFTAGNALNGAANAVLAVIKSTTGTFGVDGTASDWKGYLTYLLEDAAHGGIYTGSAVAVNLTAPDLNIKSVTALGNLETAFAELPTRLKPRISCILIKTDDENDLSGNAFGNAFDESIADFSALKGVFIDAHQTMTAEYKPVFPGVGAFYAADIIKLLF